VIQTVRNIAMLALIVRESSLPKPVVRATKSHSTPLAIIFEFRYTHTNHYCKMIDFSFEFV
jgi:hypothetical protein